MHVKPPWLKEKKIIDNKTICTIEQVCTQFFCNSTDPATGKKKKWQRYGLRVENGQRPAKTKEGQRHLGTEYKT